MFQNEKTDESGAEHPDSTGSQGKERYENVSNWNATKKRKSQKKSNCSVCHEVVVSPAA